MQKTVLSIITVLLSLNTFKSQNFDWAISMGNSGRDMGNAITIDSGGNVIAVGNFSNTVDFDLSPSVTQTLNALSGSTGMFISKLSSSSTYIWAKSFDGTSPYNYIRAVDTDANGNVYTIGEFGGITDFDPSPTGTFTLAPNGPTDIFVCKLDAAGNFVWAFRLGGSSNTDYGTSIAVDNAGNVHVTGAFTQTADFDPSPTVAKNLSAMNGSDVFVCKYTSAGNYVWAKQLGGGGGNWASSLTVDAAQNVYTTGRFNGIADFDPAPTTSNTFTSMGLSDMFVSKLDASGNFVWAKQIGGSLRENPTAIVVGANSDVFITGDFNDTTDFDPSPATYTLAPQGGGGASIFLCKLDANGAFAWAHQFSSSTGDNNSGLAIAMGSQGDVYITGGFHGTMDFDPSPTTFTLASTGGIEQFVSRYSTHGNFLWAGRMGSDSYDLGQGIAVDASENVYTTGGFYAIGDYDPSSSSSYTLSSAGLYDIFISKLKPTTNTTVGLTDNKTNNSNVTVFPNPTNGLLTLNTGANEHVSALVYNITGQQVMSSELRASCSSIDLSLLSAGIYHLVLFENGKPFYQSKVIKTNSNP